MFKSQKQGDAMKKRPASDHISTLLGMGTTIEGTLSFKDTIRLDGAVSGDIVSDRGMVIIGEQAVVEADIRVGTAIIMGTVIGQVKATERIDILAPAKIKGDIQAPVVAIESGVQFNGQCSMSQPDLPPANPQPATEKSTTAEPD